MLYVQFTLVHNLQKHFEPGCEQVLSQTRRDAADDAQPAAVRHLVERWRDRVPPNKRPLPGRNHRGLSPCIHLNQSHWPRQQPAALRAVGGQWARSLAQVRFLGGQTKTSRSGPIQPLICKVLQPCPNPHRPCPSNATPFRVCNPCLLVRRGRCRQNGEGASSHHCHKRVDVSHLQKQFYI